MTTQHIHLDPIPAERAVLWLQPHITTWTGYAFALAQRASLTPEDAARIFMQPMLPDTPTSSLADARLLEQQARQSADTMVLIHGQANVHLEGDGETWLLKTVLTDLQQNLEVWGISLDFFARWLGEQARLVGESKGIAYTTRLDRETLYMHLALMPKQ